MRKLLPLLLLCAACAHLPPLAPVPVATRATALARCRQAFPPQPWRATHTIVATLPFGHHGGLLGVTAAGPDGLQAVLLSPEGISLFDGAHGPGARGRLTILRAVPPFDRPSFAASLMTDVGNAFLPPGGGPAAVGISANGTTVCRYSPSKSDTTEVELGPEGPVQIRTYRNLQLTRRIDLLGTPKDGFFPEVRLTVPGAGGYTLDMSLVDHE